MRKMRLVELRYNIAASGFVPWKDGIVLPSLFEAVIEDDGLPHRIGVSVRVERRRRPACSRFELIQADDGPPVTTRDLRVVRLNAYVAFAVGAAAQRITDLGNGSVAIEPMGDETVTVRRSDVAPRRRGRVSDDHLREVAQVYRDAAAARQPARMAVEDHFDMPPATAARRIAAARERGFLEAITNRGGQS